MAQYVKIILNIVFLRIDDACIDRARVSFEYIALIYTKLLSKLYRTHCYIGRMEKVQLNSVTKPMFFEDRRVELWVK